MFLYGNRQGRPCRVEPLNPVKRVMDDTTGNAGLDGFTRLSQADRETGHRPSVGSAPEYPRYHEDS